MQVNDIGIYYEIHGEGFPIVMIQGLSANADWWTENIIRNLGDNYKLIIFDNRGAGKTENSDQDFSIKILADDTINLLDRLDIARFHVFGVSMGGMIAQEVVLNYPEKVEKLILGCTHCGVSKQILPSEEVIYILNRDHKKISPEKLIEGTIPLLFSENFIKNNPEFIESYRQKLLKSPMSPKSFHQQIKAISSFNSCLMLESISHPTLIIHGKKDVLVPYENAIILNKRIPNSKMILLDEAAHSFFQPNPERVINEIKNFLK
jgi:pimeloyl-ACP methyl ester carboxylesterase